MRDTVLIDSVMSKRNVVRFPREDRNARRYKSQVGNSTLPSADHKSMTVQLNVKWLLTDGKKSDKERKDRERKMKRKKTRLCNIFEIGCRRRCLSRGVGCAMVFFFFNDSSLHGSWNNSCTEIHVFNVRVFNLAMMDQREILWFKIW